MLAVGPLGPQYCYKCIILPLETGSRGQSVEVNCLSAAVSRYENSSGSKFALLVSYAIFNARSQNI